MSYEIESNFSKLPKHFYYFWWAMIWRKTKLSFYYDCRKSLSHEENKEYSVKCKESVTEVWLEVSQNYVFEGFNDIYVIYHFFKMFDLLWFWWFCDSQTSVILMSDLSWLWFCHIGNVHFLDLILCSYFCVFFLKKFPKLNKNYSNLGLPWLTWDGMGLTHHQTLHCSDSLLWEAAWSPRAHRANLRTCRSVGFSTGSQLSVPDTCAEGPLPGSSVSREDWIGIKSLDWHQVHVWVTSSPDPFLKTGGG